MITLQLVGITRIVFEYFQRSPTQDENKEAIKQPLDSQGVKGKAKFALDKIYGAMARLSPSFNQPMNGERGAIR